MVDEPVASEGIRPAGLRVAPAFDGSRADVCLARAFPGLSRAFFQRCLREGRITVNGDASRPAATVHTNDWLEIDWPEETPPSVTAEAIPLSVLAEDKDILVLNKPPGLVVHPAKGNRTGTLVHALLYHDAESFEPLLDEGLRPGIVHRLDKDTSGVMVVAKNEAARHAIKLAFAERRVEKTYLSLVLGEFGVVTGRIEAAIGRHPVNRQKMAVVKAGGKHAATRYRVLGTSEGISLVEVQIETGRTHQIRVHFAHLRHPVLGDRTYGGRRNEAPFPVDRQMLHAWKLMFPHPRSGVMRQYMAPPPADFQSSLGALGFTRIGPEA